MYGSLRGIELGKRLEAMLTVVVATLIDRDLFPALPTQKSIAAIGAEVFLLVVFAESLLNLEEVATDFAFKLRFLFAVVEVEIFLGGIADRTNYLSRHCLRLTPAFLLHQFGGALL